MTDGRQWSALRWALFIAAAAVLTAVPSLPALYMGAPIPHGLGRLWMHRDEATILADSARLLRGELIYRDYFEFPGPLSFFLNAGAFGIFGTKVIVARWVFLCTATLSGVVLAACVSRYLGAFAGLAAALAHATGVLTFWQCNYPHWFAELFVLAGLYFYNLEPEGRNRRIVAGFCLGLAVWTIQSVGLPTAICLGVAAACPGVAARRGLDALRPSLEFFVGVLLASSIILSPFLIAGGLRELFYDLFVWPFSHYGQGQFDVPSYASEYGRSVRAHETLPALHRDTALATMYLNRNLPFLLAAVGVIHFVRISVALIRGQPVHTSSIAVLTALAAVSPLLLGVSRADQSHIAFVGGLTLVGLAASVATTHRLGRWIGVGVIAFFAGTATTAHWAKLQRVELSSERWEDYVKRGGETRWVERESRPEDLLVDGTHWAGMRYLAVRAPASPFTLIPDETQKGYYSDAQWLRLARAIETRRPKVMLLTAYQFGRLTEALPSLAELYRVASSGRYLRRE